MDTNPSQYAGSPLKRLAFKSRQVQTSAEPLASLSSDGGILQPPRHLWQINERLISAWDGRQAQVDPVPDRLRRATDADGDDLNTFTAAPATWRTRATALTLPMLIGHLISRS